MMVKIRLTVFFLFSMLSFLSAQTKDIDKFKSILSTSSSGQEEMFSAMHHLFEEYHYRGDTAQSKYYANLLTKTASQKNAQTFKNQGQINQAYTLFQYEPEKGRQMIATIVEKAQVRGDSLLLGQCYIYFGKYEIEHLKKDTSCFYFEKAIQCFKNSQTLKKVDAWLGLAHCESSKSNIQAALAYATKGYNLATAEGNDILIFKTLNKMVLWNFFLRKIEVCSELLTAAKSLGEQNKYVTRDMVEIYSKIADMYWHTKNDTLTAKKYVQKAYELSKKVDNNLVKAKIATFLALTHIDTKSGNLEKAEELLKYSLDIGYKHNLNYRKTKAHHYLGRLYTKKKLYKAASIEYLKGIQICEEDKLEWMNVIIQDDLIKIIDKLPNEDKMIPFIENKLEESTNWEYHKKWNVPNYIETFFTVKMNIAQKKGNYKKALEWSQNTNSNLHDYYKKMIKGSIKEKLLEQELIVQQRELIIKEQLVEKTTFSNRLLAFGGVLSLIFLGIFMFLNQQKKRLNQEITQKNEKISAHSKQLAVFNKDLASKNDLLAKKNTLQEKEIVDFIAFQNKRDYELSHIKTEITKAIASNTPNVTALQLLNNKVSQLISNENDWLYFKQKITSLYPNFFNNLLLKHTNLNEREQLHCAYILLGMSVKKVAESIFVSIKAVESARYRIKKKMGLDKTNNLSDYIRSFGTRQ